MEDIDRLLRTPDGVEPSPGFVAEVMVAVRREHRDEPAPSFPWLPLGAGLAVAAALAATGALLLSRVEGTSAALAASSWVMARCAPVLMAAVATLLGLGLARLPRALAGDWGG